MPLPQGFTTPEPNDEIKALARSASRADPAMGSSWQESATGRVFQVVHKPLDAATLEPMVTLNYPGYGYFAMTAADFLSREPLEGGGDRPRFVETSQ